LDELAGGEISEVVRRSQAVTQDSGSRVSAGVAGGVVCGYVVGWARVTDVAKRRRQEL
jgi:hypothetical protein